MRRLRPFGIVCTMLLVMPAGCSPTMEEQLGTFARDFLLQVLAAFLF